ncbi:MAG: hypothetical protein ACFFAU_01555 [Candidatus Hodarchaeota archaeon]
MRIVIGVLIVVLLSIIGLIYRGKRYYQKKLEDMNKGDINEIYS